MKGQVHWLRSTSEQSMARFIVPLSYLSKRVVQAGYSIFIPGIKANGLPQTDVEYTAGNQDPAEGTEVTFGEAAC